MRDLSDLRAVLGLRRVPHYTTLQKASVRLHGRYGQRWQVECTNAMLKRRLSATVNARSYWSQCREVNVACPDVQRHGTSDALSNCHVECSSEDTYMDRRENAL